MAAIRVDRSQRRIERYLAQERLVVEVHGFANICLNALALQRLQRTILGVQHIKFFVLQDLSSWTPWYWKYARGTSEQCNM